MVGRLVAPAVVVVDCCSRALAWSPTGGQCIISSHLLLMEETYHHTPSLHVATESTSRVTQHHRSTAKTDTKQQHSSGLALCSHTTLDVIPRLWLQPGHLLVPPSHEGAVDGTAEAPDQQVARPTRSRTDTSHYNKLQHGSRSDATAIPPMVKCTTSNVPCF